MPTVWYCLAPATVMRSHNQPQTLGPDSLLAVIAQSERVVDLDGWALCCVSDGSGKGDWGD